MKNVLVTAATIIAAGFGGMAQAADSYVDITLQPAALEFRQSGAEQSDAGGGLAIDALAMVNANVGFRFSISDLTFDDFDNSGDDVDLERNFFGIRVAQNLSSHSPELFGEIGLGQLEILDTDFDGLIISLGMRVQSPSNTELEIVLSRHDFEIDSPFFSNVELDGFKLAGKAAFPMNESLSIVAGIAISEYEDNLNPKLEIGVVDYNIGLRVVF